MRSSTDKHYSLDSEDDFRSGCWNVSHHQQFFSELHSPGRSHYTNYWYSWVQTIYCVTYSTTPLSCGQFGHGIMIMPDIKFVKSTYNNVFNVGSVFTNTLNVQAYVPRPRTEYAKGSLHYRGSVLWNKIPLGIRHLCRLKVFKTSLNGKGYFLYTLH